MDTSTIIWIIVAGAAMLLSQPNRKKRRRPSTPEGEQPQQTAPQRPASRTQPVGQPQQAGMPTPASPWPLPGFPDIFAEKQPATARTEASSRPANAPRKPRSPKQTQAQRMGSRTETRANQSTDAAAGQRPAGTSAQEPTQKAQFGPQEESAARIAAEFDPAPGRDLFGDSEAQIRGGIDGTQATDSGRPRARDGRPGQVTTTLPPGRDEPRQRQHPGIP